MPDEEILSGDWEKFEAWIREQVGGDFIWKIKPFDKKANRQAVMESILDDFVKNPYAALHFIFSHSDVHLSTPCS